MKTPLLPVAGLSAALLLSACGAAESGDDARPSVVASFYPVQVVAERVGGDLIDLTVLTEPGGEPHDLELSPRQVADVQDVDVVLYQSDFQAAVDEAIEQADRDAGTVVDFAEGVELRPAEDDGHDHGAEDEHSEEEGHDHTDEEESHEGHDHADEDESHEGHDHADEESDEHSGHDHGGLDPHLWLDPANLVPAAEATAEALAAADPDHAEDYRANAATLIEELEALEDEIDEGLASCEVDVVVTSHAAFGYLTGPHGLEQVSIAGINPGTEPSASRLAEIADLVESEGITTVFTETLVSPAVARTIADEAGVETATLDPLEGLSEDTQDEDYFSIMRANLDALQKANSCS